MAQCIRQSCRYFPSNRRKLTEKIRLEQSKFEIDIAQLLQGHQPKPKKNCYRKRDECISRLVLGYDQSQIFEYLKNVSPNISL